MRAARVAASQASAAATAMSASGGWRDRAALARATAATAAWAAGVRARAWMWGRRGVVAARRAVGGVVEGGWVGEGTSGHRARASCSAGYVSRQSLATS